MKNRIAAVLLSSALVVSTLFMPVPTYAIGEGPNFNGNETVKNERTHNYDEMVKFLKQVEKRSDVMTLEVYGQSVKGRDLYLVKFGEYDSEKPTFLVVTQQHGNEVMTTEAALEMIKHLASNGKEVKDWIDKVNILIAPRINVDGAEGDVDFSLEDYASGSHTRYNANKADLNRDHNQLAQPETKALHENVLQKYNPDYMIDFHHQGRETTLGDTDELVSGSILYPTNEGVDPEVVIKSKQLGSVIYDVVESRGFGTLSKYVGGSANTIARNQLAYEYGIATLLFEMRGMADHYIESAILGQKSNGYLIKQAVISMEAAIDAIADGSINDANISFWDTLPESTYNKTE